MIRRFILGFALAGCDVPEIGTPPAEWQLDMTAGGGAIVRTTPDGSFIVAVPASSQIGATQLSALSFARVNRVGELVTTVPISMISNVGSMEVAADGAPVVVVPSSSNPWVAGFDAAFAPRWVLRGDANRQFDYVAPVAVGADGTTVVLGSVVTQPTTSSIRYLAPSGVQQWKVPVETWQRRTISLSDNGEVVVCEYPDFRQRLSASGVVVEDAQVPCTGLRLSDGGYTFIDRLEIVRIDGAGGTVWRRPLMSSVESLFVSRSGDILAITSERSQVARFDGATGELTASHDNRNAGFMTDAATIVWADPDGYVLLQASGLARYAGP